MIFRSICCCSIALTLLTARTAFSSDAFLYLDGIEGESRSTRHFGWIELESFSIAAAKTTNTAVVLHPLSIFKKLDKSSHQLVQQTAQGRIIRNGLAEIYRSGERSARFLQLKLENVRVASFSQSGAAGDTPWDSFTLEYEAIRWTFTEISTEEDALRDITATWNQKTQVGSGGIIAEDIDSDGMPDEYERIYNLKVDRPDANEDPDNDGMTNIEEFRAGTVPNSSNSIFRVSGARTLSGETSLTWQPASGKTYRLMGTSSPDKPFEFIRFLTEAEALAGELRLPPTGAFRFFVLEVD